MLAGIGQLAARADMIAKAATLIPSPAPQAREREITARYTAALARVFTEGNPSGRRRHRGMGGRKQASTSYSGSATLSRPKVVGDDKVPFRSRAA